eukprot:CAMPEP_0118640094 /NCGR_PEP_ID=MMETSP0785-20121206/4571_1 /TAXON_ID=91992 /ORGANISM="Bolidomonas pacifica, Strain CCMP 1866" /LENGTH=735 /DNA_ID=CAMNT_0006531461 /DNA_START=289 /DNA_END=2496 /DNA_ORIENTATION=+
MAACISLMVIILFTVTFETGTEKIDKMLKGTPYKEMVDKIYRELTILGLISFIIFLTLQSGAELNDSYFLAFEFSHIVIFFAALYFVLSAAFMMFMNSRMKIFIDQVAAKSSDQCIKDYKAHQGKIGHFGNLKSSQVEFKLYDTFFCSTHKLPISVFDFGMYMRDIFDEHVVQLIEVEISSWIIMIILLGVNIFLIEVLNITGKATSSSSRRLDEFDHLNDDFDIVVPGRTLRDFVARQLGSTPSICGRRLGETTSECTRRYLDEALYGLEMDEYEEDDASFLANVTDYSDCCCFTDAGRRRAAASADPCAVKTDGMEYSLILGWLLVILTFFLHVMYRHAEIKIRKIIGCPSLDSACNYIAKVEEELLAEEKKLLELHMKKKEKEHQNVRQRTFVKNEELIDALKAGEGKDHLYGSTGDITRIHIHTEHHDHEHQDAVLALGAEVVQNVAGTMRKQLERASSKLMVVSPTTQTVRKVPPNHPNAVNEEDEDEEDEVKDEVREMEFAKKDEQPGIEEQITFKPRGSQKETKQRDKKIKMELEQLNRRVEIGYKKLLDLVMLFNCFYFAVFSANYSLITLNEEHLPWLWFTLSLLPGFITLYICGKVVRTQGVIGAICVINLEVVEKVFNETEELFHTGHEIFHEFREKLQFLHIRMQDLEDEYKKIDKDHSGDVSFAEFKKGLAELGIHFHGGKNMAWKLFRLCDEDRSGKIDIKQLTKMVFPNAHNKEKAIRRA